MTVQFGEDHPWGDLPPVDREKANKELESWMVLRKWTCRFCGGTFADRAIAIQHAIDCDQNEYVHSCARGDEMNDKKAPRRSGMSLWQHYDKVITRMHQDICRLIEEKAEIEANVEMLIAIRDQARAVHSTGAGTYNAKRTSVDRKKLSDLGMMVKESYKTIPSEELAQAHARINKIVHTSEAQNERKTLAWNAEI